MIDWEKEAREFYHGGETFKLRWAWASPDSGLSREEQEQKLMAAFARRMAAKVLREEAAKFRVWAGAGDDKVHYLHVADELGRRAAELEKP